MPKCCLVTLLTPAGEGVAEVHVNSLHQLAVMMPATVTSYHVQDKGDCMRPSISDSELYDLLVALVADIFTMHGE